MFYALLLRNKDIHAYSDIFVVFSLQFEKKKKNNNNNNNNNNLQDPFSLSINLSELQPGVGSTAHHYTEVVSIKIPK